MVVSLYGNAGSSGFNSLYTARFVWTFLSWRMLVYSFSLLQCLHLVLVWGWCWPHRQIKTPLLYKKVQTLRHCFFCTHLVEPHMGTLDYFYFLQKVLAQFVRNKSTEMTHFFLTWLFISRKQTALYLTTKGVFTWQSQILSHLDWWPLFVRVL